MSNVIVKSLGFMAILFLIFSVNACSSAEKQSEKQADVKNQPEAVKMQITSPAFKEGQPIPVEYTADGSDISPALQWGILPSGTKSLALICDDPDAPMGTWVHWVVYNLPPTISGLPQAIAHGESIPGGGNQGKNGSGMLGYNGPAPPSGTHHYFFKVYALDTMLPLQIGATKADLLKAMEGHFIGKGELMGTYSR